MTRPPWVFLPFDRPNPYIDELASSKSVGFQHKEGRLLHRLTVAAFAALCVIGTSSLALADEGARFVTSRSFSGVLGRCMSEAAVGH